MKWASCRDSPDEDVMHTWKHTAFQEKSSTRRCVVVASCCLIPAPTKMIQVDLRGDLEASDDMHA